METWKKIDWIAGNYWVSDHGRIKNGNTGRILKTQLNGQGRIDICLAPHGRQGKKVCVRLHRCVAIAFLDNPNDLPEVNHKDGDPKNNLLSNLEWCTKSENIRHAFDTGLMVMPKGFDSKFSILTEEQVAGIRSDKRSQRAIAEAYGVSKTLVCDVKAQRRYNQCVAQ